MSNPEDERVREDLEATSESLEVDAKRLARLEHDKRNLDAADPQVDFLSIEAERLALEIQQKSRIERDLADDLTPGGEPPTRSH